MNRIETKIIVMVTNKLAAAKECEAKTDLIEELSENLYQRYLDLTAAGVPEQEALQQAMDSLGDVRELLEYLAYLSEEEGGAGGQEELTWKPLEPLESLDSMEGESQSDSKSDDGEENKSENGYSYGKNRSQGFSTERLEKGIEDIVNMAMSAARGAVDLASDTVRSVSKELKEKYPDGIRFEFNSKNWSNGRSQDDSDEDCECVIPCDTIHSIDVNLTNGDIHFMVEDAAQNITLSGDTSGVEFAIGEDGVLSVRQRTTASSSVLFGRGGGWADLEITVPFKPWKRIGLQSIAGDITLEDSLVCDALYLNSKSGDVTLDAGSSLINAEKMAVRTLSGDVNASGLVGSLYINSTSGDVTVEDCDLQTCGVIATSGDICVECRAKEMNCSSSSGDIEITCIDQAPNSVKVATTAGDVCLEMYGGDGFTLAYRTVSGDISYDVDNLDQWTEQRDSNKKGAIIYRSGQPTQVQISTVSGDIDLMLEP